MKVTQDDATTITDTTPADNDHNLRIACLLPSATDICIALGLAPFIVGVTHECNMEALLQARREEEDCPPIRILTGDGLATITSQQDIHKAVSAQLASNTAQSCSLPSDNSAITTKTMSFSEQQPPPPLPETTKTTELPPSLYPILQDEFHQSNPTLVITQDLCSVCAPSTSDVEQILQFRRRSPQQDDDNDDDPNRMENENENHYNDNHQIQILSLQPTNLAQVSDSFVAVAQHCHVVPMDRGYELKTTFLSKLICLKQTILSACGCHPEEECQRTRTQTPTLLLLEWLEPPFDGGHWILQMMEYAGVKPALSKTNTAKSEEISWQDIGAADPDCVLVACCGFDLQRNMKDALQAQHQLMKLGKASANNHIFACNGDQYFARPGPSLLMGTIIMALCAYHNEPHVIQAIRSLPFVPDHVPGYEQVIFPTTTTTTNNVTSSSTGSCGSSGTGIPDIEDTLQVKDKQSDDDGEDGFAALHDTACANGEMSYNDPATGYSVFTELAHKKRGKCCGSGCRHCPYSHENVVDKVNRIQQPAFLYDARKDTTDNKDSLFLCHPHAPTKVLFFSGGKDSFLTIRSLVKQYYNSGKSSPFGLVLLTTFDSESRIIAHQDVHVENVVRQCQHMNISLLGVPMHRASKEPYAQKIRKALEVIRKDIGNGEISTLVFGDLHLDHIRSWRDNQLGSLGYELEYPLWKAKYEDLTVDLEASKVPCALTAVTVDSSNGISVGDVFDRDFSNMVTAKGIDGFGEKGEFHSLAQVWEVTRHTALGIPDVAQTIS